jgi:hypothetical protein
MQKQYGAQSDKGMFCANSSQQSYIAGQHQQDAFISHEQLFRGPFINDVFTSFAMSFIPPSLPFFMPPLFSHWLKAGQLLKLVFCWSVTSVLAIKVR